VTKEKKKEGLRVIARRRKKKGSSSIITGVLVAISKKKARNIIREGGEGTKAHYRSGGKKAQEVPRNRGKEEKKEN